MYLQCVDTTHRTTHGATHPWRKAWIRYDTRKLLNTTGKVLVRRVFSRGVDLLEMMRNGVHRRPGAVMKSRETARPAVALAVSDGLDVSVDASFLSSVSAMLSCYGWSGQYLQSRSLRAGLDEPWSSEKERDRPCEKKTHANERQRGDQARVSIGLRP